MPAENPDLTPPRPHNDWEQLAQTAAHQQEPWDLGHPGVRELYDNHVVRQLHQRGLGHLAIGTEGQASPADIPLHTPEALTPPEDDAARLESERKKNTTENLRVLQKRFGERFVKGTLMEGGGYTGGAARELLASFMDQPGFAGELKRIIPDRHGALQLLKDNYDYIQAALEQVYKDNPTHERAPLRDPYELARSVGYELTGPFTSTAEFVPYDKLDFQPGRLSTERLCTFNNPGARLKEYHILWLRHHEVGETLPANQLTVDTLSDAWKTYLKTVGRYERDADTYDLAGLRPARDDPYGISSMSVQISRSGNHVSIKNRYNHLVGNPDNTLDSDLDNVAYGLKRAVYARVGREDLMNKAGVALAEGYIADNDGGIHHYKYEEDNVCYGDYKYIENGRLTSIDPGKYHMISPQLYLPKSAKDSVIRLGKRENVPTGLEVSDDVKFLYDWYKIHIEGTPQELPTTELDELRKAQAERDLMELHQRVYESLIEQVTSSYKGYSEVASQLGAQMASEQEFTELFEAKMNEWRQNGVMDYLVRDLIENGNQPNLLATPNVVADWQQLRQVAVNFGKNQPYETYAYDDLYRHYSAQELSGQPTDGKLRFSVMPSGYTHRLGQTPVDGQLAALRQLQAEQPSLGMRIPSVLEAITYWQTLRAKNGSVAGFDATYIRHFDLKPVRVGSWLSVPDSYVFGVGEPGLRNSDAEYGDDARVLVG